MEFDEQQAIAFIRARIPQDWGALCDDDEILNIIDMIWDYYEDNGMLDIDAAFSDDEAVADADALKAYVARMLSKDKAATLTADQAACVVDAELAYEQSIGLAE